MATGGSIGLNEVLEPEGEEELQESSFILLHIHELFQIVVCH